MLSPRASGGSTSQTAARLLIILDKLGQAPSSAEKVVFPDAVKVIRAMSRFAKLDFWLRNPDYLADEVLTDIEAGYIEPEVGLPHVDRMLSGDAPLLHLYPMQRYKYGAWELPDNAIAVLKSYDFVAQRRAKEVDIESASQARRDYFLRGAGEEALVNMRSQVSQMEWYDQQAEAIRLLHLGPSGAAAKNRQYLQPEYRATPVGQPISLILERVRPRFLAVATHHGYQPTDYSDERNLAAGDMS